MAAIYVYLGEDDVLHRYKQQRTPLIDRIADAQAFAHAKRAVTCAFCGRISAHPRQPEWRYN